MTRFSCEVLRRTIIICAEILAINLRLVAILYMRTCLLYRLALRDSFSYCPFFPNKTSISYCTVAHGISCSVECKRKSLGHFQWTMAERSTHPTAGLYARVHPRIFATTTKIGSAPSASCAVAFPVSSSMLTTSIHLPSSLLSTPTAFTMFPR